MNDLTQRQAGTPTSPWVLPAFLYLLASYDEQHGAMMALRKKERAARLTFLTAQTEH